MTTKLRIILLIALWFGIESPFESLAQSTAFTYNGRLNSGGAPSNGPYEIQFTLYDSNAGGNLVGGPITVAPVDVASGLFTARIDFGANVFLGPPRWLGIAVRPIGAANFTLLSPRQEVTSSPYAIRAQSAGTALDVTAGTVVKSLNNLKDNVTLAAGANVTITPNGNTLTIGSAGSGGSGIWSVNANDAYYTAGNVGIGTTTPTAGNRLEVNGAALLTPGGSGGNIQFDTPNAETGMTIAGVNRADIRFDGSTLKLLAGAGRTIPASANGITINTSGNVGIGGSYNPVAKLEVVAQDAVRLIGYQPFLTLIDANAGYTRSRIQGVNGDLTLFTESYLNGSNPFSFLKLANTGNVGIGSATPQGKLEVVAQDALRLIGYQPFLTLLDSAAGYARSRIQGVNGEIVLEPESVVNGSNPNASVVIANSGNVSVATLTIRGGADLAEPFELSRADIAKGSVVIIDSENPGKLKLSDQPYDRRVAGVVSGANGVNPGISLHQSGILEAGQNVALSGRVYVLADARYGAIKPGDLLTTSDTPGHAMKVTDHSKAQGAILGKAMSSLEEDKGMVLMLVTLQ